jgi:hypothetical protein
MRDPARIERILQKLKVVWEIDPDMRFGQLTYMLFWQIPQTKRVTARQGGGWDIAIQSMIDPFYVEDDVFEAFLDRVIADRK